MGGSAHGMAREVDIVIEAYVRGTANYDNTLDTICVEVEEAVATDLTRGGNAKDTLLESTEFELSGEGDQPVARCGRICPHQFLQAGASAPVFFSTLKSDCACVTTTLAMKKNKGWRAVNCNATEEKSAEAQQASTPNIGLGAIARSGFSQFKSRRSNGCRYSLRIPSCPWRPFSYRRINRLEKRGKRFNKSVRVVRAAA